MARSEAQKKADKKYHETHLKSFTVNAKISDYDKITQYCEANSMSKSKLLLESARYIIDNEIDLSPDKK
jgi:hypothetical protein